MTTLILVKPYGRFGNQVISIIEAIYWCEQKPVDTLDISRMFNTKSLFIHDKIHIHASCTRKETLRYRHVQHVNSTTYQSTVEKFYLAGSCPLTERRRIITTYIVPILDISLKEIPVKLGAMDLVIHCRGGDVFRKPQPAYTQPPIDFYNTVIESKEWKNIYVVCEEKSNVLVKTLLQKKNVSFIDESPFSTGRNESDLNAFKIDLRVLLTTENLVVCNSSLSPFLLCANLHLKNVYMSSFYLMGYVQSQRSEPSLWWKYLDSKEQTTAILKKKEDAIITFLTVNLHVLNYTEYTNVAGMKLYDYNNKETLKRFLEFKRKKETEEKKE